MNDLLFNLPDSPIPPLARLRAEYNAAQAAYDEAYATQDAIPCEIMDALKRARVRLLEEEVRLTNS